MVSVYEWGMRLVDLVLSSPSFGFDFNTMPVGTNNSIVLGFRSWLPSTGVRLVVTLN